jgi:hypothetical protein|tara:strand:+ start:134 stop:460 length:327 start_codon:yes stop_codon:yes gene_type:complete
MFGFQGFAVQGFSQATPSLDIQATTNVLTGAVGSLTLVSQVPLTTAGEIASTAGTAVAVSIAIATTNLLTAEVNNASIFTWAAINDNVTGETWTDVATTATTEIWSNV